MKKFKPFIKYIAYFIIGYLIITIIYSIVQISQLNDLNYTIDLKNIVTKTMKSLIILYTILYFLILILNILFNVILAEKLNIKSLKMRKLSKEKFSKERSVISMKKKILVIIFIIILILLFIFVGNLIRKFIIIKDLQNKIDKYISNTNYFMKETHIENDTVDTYETYNKGDLAKLVMTHDNGELTIYFDHENAIGTYMDAETNEIKRYNLEFPKRKLDNPYLLYSENEYNNSFVELLLTKIRKQNYNNIDCYVVSNSFTDYIYIDKETGLILKKIEKNSEITYEYKFNSVFDENVNMQ